MKALAALIFLLLGPSFLLAENRPKLFERVDAFCEKYPTIEAAEKRFQEWSQAEPQNPDPYIFFANALIRFGDSVVIDEKSIHAGVNVVSGRRALKVLATAAEKFPTRLDIHVGRMSTARQINAPKEVETAATVLLQAVSEHSKEMRWLDGQELEMPLEHKVTGELQGRIRWLYEKEKPDTDLMAFHICEAALKLYPSNVELLNSASHYHFVHEEWAASLDLLKRASAADPTDVLVIANLGLVSAKLGDNSAARSYWNEVLRKAPESEFADEAKEALAKLDAGGGKKENDHAPKGGDHDQTGKLPSTK